MSVLDPLPKDIDSFLKCYLPENRDSVFPFVTLTYAQSLDSKIAAKAGVRTVISHPETKSMTHYLRSKHEAILVGINTVLTDNPSLNCKFNDHMITPVIIDPNFKLKEYYPTSKLFSNVTSEEGKEPIVFISNKKFELIEDDLEAYLEKYPMKVISIPTDEGKMDWGLILKSLKRHSYSSVMIEGGATIINELLLRSDLVDSLIITIGPVFLGKDGVDVSPSAGIRLQNVNWWTGIQDSVMCANL
ncbi:2,5-diamino-6-(ribosylamino)-4(3H)-pyrimidinone 5'-phosphate reductase [Martiniozyma asiatica (nom. inval.)]|nr:2,5-diamino-6-(ribosylamino)-4(3H)-pyrimidinone 5'-phosphate reductase [Martiniozyma asiatica]